MSLIKAVKTESLSNVVFILENTNVKLCEYMSAAKLAIMLDLPEIFIYIFHFFGLNNEIPFILLAVKRKSIKCFDIMIEEFTLEYRVKDDPIIFSVANLGGLLGKKLLNKISICEENCDEY